MKVVAIVGGGPESYLPTLSAYREEVSVWIGADRGALSLIEQKINPDIAIGDFDSVNMEEKEQIRRSAGEFRQFKSEKDETDLELALQQAIEFKPDVVFLFGVTGGRLDHELANLQLLYALKEQGVEGKVIDKNNEVGIAFPGSHSIEKQAKFPYVSFLPLTPQVKGITLKGFFYPLTDASINWGSTLCISNKVANDVGVLIFTEGIIYIIHSKDPVKEPEV